MTLGAGESAGARSSAARNAPVRIGFSNTETGPDAAPAQFDLQGYQLGAPDINAHGGLLGHKVELVYYDDEGSTAKADQLYQRLITTDQVNLLVGP